MKFNTIEKEILKIYISQAMLVYAIARLNDTSVTTNKIAEEYTDKIMEELK